MFFRSSDLMEVEGFVTQFVTPHRMHVRRPSAGFVAELEHRTNAVQWVNRLAYGTEVSVAASEFDDFYVLVVPLAGAGEFSCAGRIAAMDAAHGAIVAPLRRYRTSNDASFVKLIAKIDRASLDDFARVHEIELACDVEPAIALDRPGASIGLAMRRLYAASGARGSPLEVATLHSDLMRGVLLACSTPPARLRTKASLTVVARAEAYIEAMAREPLTLEAIAVANDVSPRVLQSSFRVHRNTTPILHLRDVRLDQAYRDLRAGTRLITEVAFDAGFSHLGRFSSEYRTRFGELPSATRARARAALGEVLRDRGAVGAAEAGARIPARASRIGAVGTAGDVA